MYSHLTYSSALYYQSFKFRTPFYKSCFVDVFKLLILTMLPYLLHLCTH